MSYTNQCGSCTSYSFEGDNSKGYCSYYGSYYYPGDTCSHYSSSNCYITTMVCEKLGFADDCTVLEVLRGFRDNVMQKDSKYKDMLFEYDTVGPQIAKCIGEDKVGKEISQGFYNTYIEPTARLVAANRYDEAVAKYKKMTEILRDYYGIEKGNTDSKDYDYTKGGHGKVKKLGEWPTI